jgi:uncharacterized protein involved in exopolysaccharide biosynthesis
MASQSPRPGGGNQFGDAESDLPALGAALWRNKWQIVRPTVLAALIAIAVVEMIVPKYLSEARVLIEGRDNVFLRPNADKDLIDRGTVDQEAVTSQVQLILSRDLASEVIDKLKLGERPEFDPAIAGISPLKKVLGIIGVIKNPMRMTPEERVLDAYYNRLQVFPVEKSRVIVIDFLSEDPKLAAEVANTIAEAYLGARPHRHGGLAFVHGSRLRRPLRGRTASGGCGWCRSWPTRHVLSRRRATGTGGSRVPV